MNTIQIGHGTVYHQRFETKLNLFRYPIFFIYLKCDQEIALHKIMKSKFYRLLSFSRKDHFKSDEGSLSKNIKLFLNDFCHYSAEEVWLHTFPRMFGYVFNPISFWICRRDGKIDAVLVEVNNTFHERHYYWISPQKEILATEWYQAEKVFHVSPFFPVDGYYQFRFHLEPTFTKMNINYFSPEGNLRLATSVEGVLEPLQNQSVFKLILKYGWMTLLIIMRIHFQALKLWILKIKFYKKPAPPDKGISS